MKKAISAILLVSVSFAAFSQSDSLETSAKEVQQLISTHSDKLDEDDKLTVEKKLNNIIQIFKMNGYAAPNSIPYACDSQDNKLINLDTGALVYDFSNQVNCHDALVNLKNGKGFCSYDDSRLFSQEGKFVFDFFDLGNCKDAVTSIFRVKRFCDYSDSTLRKMDGTLLYDFFSVEDCLKALN